MSTCARLEMSSWGLNGVGSVQLQTDAGTLTQNEEELLSGDRAS